MTFNGPLSVYIALNWTTYLHKFRGIQSSVRVSIFLEVVNMNLTRIAHDPLTIVTRNSKDFPNRGLMGKDGPFDLVRSIIRKITLNDLSHEGTRET